MTEQEEENCCEPYIVKCIMDYSYCQTQVTECCHEVYNTVGPIKNCVDGIVSLHHSILSQCYYVEPDFENWLCIAYIDNDGKLKEEYSEIGELSFNILTTIEISIKKKKNKTAFSILKLKNEYFINLHKTFYSAYFSSISSNTNENYQCTYSFLSIVYKKGNEDEDNQSISIDLDRGYYMNKNIILTPTFILRELTYKNISPELFDAKNYIVEIMDQNLNVFTIHSDQYILLEKDNYVIINVDSDYSDSATSSEDIGMEII